VRAGFRPDRALRRDAIELALPPGAQLVACAAGEVVNRLWRDPRFGTLVRVDHGYDRQGVRWMSELRFLDEARAWLWKTVRQGEPLGTAGLVPDADGPRPGVCLAVLRNGRAVDPLPAIDWSPFELQLVEGGAPRAWFRPEESRRPHTDLDWELALVRAGLPLGCHGPRGDGVDGVWGELDQYALECFQAEHGLSVGRRDRATAEALTAALGERREAA
jgi:hypothetical protein